MVNKYNLQKCTVVSISQVQEEKRTALREVEGLPEIVGLVPIDNNLVTIMMPYLLYESLFSLSSALLAFQAFQVCWD